MFSKVSNELTWLQKLCIDVLKVGSIPRHVAIIMDGNRRFAKKINIERQLGHYKGFDVMLQSVMWCMELGVMELTVYMFGIQNFKRSTDEVQDLMDLFYERWALILNEKDTLMSNGVCVRIVGEFSLLPTPLQQVFAELMFLTKDNTKFIWNVACAYTSRYEITNAIRTVVDGVNSGLITEDDINEQVLASCLFIRAPDVLIRTSGETRLSDFLLCQLGYSYIHVIDILWPEFCIWNLLAAVFKYQRIERNIKPESVTSQLTYRTERFLESVNASRWLLLQQYSSTPC